jgi:hypothetical protein
MALDVCDWLRRARDAAAPGDRSRCLDAAASLARHSYQWSSILATLTELPAVAPPRVGHLARQALASAWFAAARLRADALSDEDGARQALRERPELPVESRPSAESREHPRERIIGRGQTAYERPRGMCVRISATPPVEVDAEQGFTADRVDGGRAKRASRGDRHHSSRLGPLAALLG